MSPSCITVHTMCCVLCLFVIGTKFITGSTSNSSNDIALKLQDNNIILIIIMLMIIPVFVYCHKVSITSEPVFKFTYISPDHMLCEFCR